jgi:hypothetical protein
MTIVHSSKNVIALTCYRVLNENVGARVHPHTSSLTPSFGRASKTYPDSFNLIFYDLVFRFFMHMKVFKVGVVTGLTEGTVVFVDEDRLMVKVENQTGIFS